MPRAAAGDRWRRALTVGLAGLLAASVAGCGLGGGARPTPEPSPGPTTSGPTHTATAPATPATAQAYAEAAVAAWAAPDLLRLRDLATPEVRQALIELPGPPDPHWTLVACEETSQHSECAFYNRAGDWLVITVDHDRLSDRAAVTEARFTATSYPDDPVDYVTALVTAWQQGNLARMQRLAVPAVVDVFTGVAPPGAVPDQTAYRVTQQTGTAVTVTVTVTGPEHTTEITTTVRASSLGQAQAVRAATLGASAATATDPGRPPR
ncbi:MAG TPA: hypothetical protein VKZ67_12930 [Natronosporangium sp.]|nr:hypothetical protein [Natronosporangium sp.]